jgi:hypothetical protein
MLKFFSIFSLDFLALRCLDLPHNMHPYYSQVYLWCIAPIVIAQMIILHAAVKICATDYVSLIFIPRWFRQRGERILNDDGEADTTSSSSSTASTERRQQSIILFRNIVTQHSWSLLFLSYIVLPVVSNKQLQIFDCIEFESGDEYLREDTSVDCKSDEYYSFRATVSTFIFIYQLIPIVWMLLLARHVKDLTPHSMKFDENLALFTRDNNPDLAHIKFLFNDYKCSKWWFEVADMYRRIIFIGILPLMSPQSATRASFGLFLGFVSHIGFSYHEPYRAHFANTIASIAQVNQLVAPFPQSMFTIFQYILC